MGPGSPGAIVILGHRLTPPIVGISGPGRWMRAGDLGGAISPEWQGVISHGAIFISPALARPSHGMLSTRFSTSITSTALWIPEAAGVAHGVVVPLGCLFCSTWGGAEHFSGGGLTGPLRYFTVFGDG